MRYNCSILDLSIVATVNGEQITTELAVHALYIAIKRHKPGKGLILHSDQGSQFTSKKFVHFCEAAFIQQSMNRAGCPYDNAPIERYFNTLKHESVHIFEFSNAPAMDRAVAEFAYGWYNRIRPHSFNGVLHQQRPGLLDYILVLQFAWPCHYLLFPHFLFFGGLFLGFGISVDFISIRNLLRHEKSNSVFYP